VEYNKQIQNYRLFNAETDKTRKRQTLDYGTLFRSRSIYLDHSRSDSMSSLSTRVQSPTLDLELALKTPLNDEFENLPSTPSLEEELKKSAGLSTTLTDLMTDIDDSIKISPQTVKDLEDRILALTQEKEAYQLEKRQQESAMQELVQKNTLLQEQLNNAEKKTEDLEKAVLTLNQNNLAQQEREKDLQQQLRGEKYDLQSADKRRLAYHGFIRQLAEVFPFSEEQAKKLTWSES